MNHNKIVRNSFILILSFLFLEILPINAQYLVLHNFNDTSGGEAFGDLTLSGSKLFGMTFDWSGHDSGCIFSMDTSGNEYKVLISFTGANGKTPFGSLILSGNKLYGMTFYGGINNDGCIFSIDTNGNSYKKLLDFNGINGFFPQGSLTLNGSRLFGMADGGIYNQGIIFSIDTSGTDYKKLFDFDDTNGSHPAGNLTLVGNKLFGMTVDGGVINNNDGNIFSIDTNGKNFKNLYYFNGINGQRPMGSLILSENKLYGMTSWGGIYGDGNIFSIDTDGSGIKDLLDFNRFNGELPNGSLLLSGKALYGMTYEGGIYSPSPPGDGVIFSIDTNGNNYKELFDFNNNINGIAPNGSLIFSGNMLYGMTLGGGEFGWGVIFKIDTSNNVTGVNELKTNSEEVKVFPNPNNGIFQLVISNEQVVIKSTVEIYNMLGERVFSSNQPIAISHQPINIDLSGEPSGIYLYRVLTETGELAGEGKFVIQK